MKKIKFVMIIFSIFLVLILSIMLLKNESKENIVVEDDIKVKNSNLAIMIEKEIGSGDYEESDSNLWPKENYVFNAKLSKCTNGSKLKYNEGTVNVTTNKTDKCYLYFDIDALGSVCRGENMAKCIKDNYKKDSTIIYHDGVADYDGEENWELEAGDNSYRYTGNTNVDNYVCFGSNKDTCPYENLFRIIGLFDDDHDGNYNIKLIAGDYLTSDESKTDGAYVAKFPYVTSLYVGKKDLTKIGGYDYNNVTKLNDWEQSPLNTITLNKNYLTYFSDTWQSLIEYHNWQVGGASFTSLVKNGAKVAFDNEIGNLQENKKSSDFKIGMMYLSDYYYGMLPDYWNYPGYPDGSYCANISYCKKRQYNWLFLGLWEWLITPITGGTTEVFGIGQEADIPRTIVYGASSVRHAAVRPVFYLINDVKLVSGAGTSSNPYRISL